MDPAAAYRHDQALAWTRIDMLLALFDGAISRLELAGQALQAGQAGDVAAHTLRAQRLVIELIAGLDLRHGDLAARLRDLYVFVLDRLAQRTPDSLHEARRILQLLREAFRAIRPQAIELERAGHIPTVGEVRAVEIVA